MAGQNGGGAAGRSGDICPDHGECDGRQQARAQSVRAADAAGTRRTEDANQVAGEAVTEPLAKPPDEPGATDIQQSAGMQEIRGRIKWFDTARGFGFITWRDGPDVMLHADTLRRDGRLSLREGALVTCIAAEGPRGLHVVRLLAVDEADALHPAELEARTHVMVTPESGLEAATVKWFNRLRGFGFVSCGEGQPDIFVHMEVARRCGMLALEPGQRVAVRYGASPRGLMATEIYPLDHAGAGVRH